MRRPLGVFCLLVILTVAAGLQLRPPDTFSYGETVGEEVYLAGRIYAKEIKEGDAAKGGETFLLQFFIEPEELFFQNRQIPYQNNFICSVTVSNLDESVPAMGSRVLVKGILYTYEEATNPGQFDAKSYYAALGISAQLREAELLGYDGEQDFLAEGLWQLRQLFSAQLSAVFPKKEGAVVKTMLLGDKSSLDAEVKELYRGAGILHILSVSGLHVSFLGMGLYRMLRRMTIPVGAAVLISGSFVVLYGMMIGFPVSACRAIGMFLLRLLADGQKRTYDMLTALAFAGMVMVCTNPFYLMQTGFLYSCSAILGIALCAPLFSKRSRRLQPIFTALSVLAFTLPVQLYFYYEVPLYALFLNLAVIPLAGTVLLFSCVSLVFSFLFFPAAPIISIVVQWILKGYELGAGMAVELPGNTCITGRPTLWQILLYYGLLLVAVFWKKPANRYRVGLFCGGLLILFTTVIGGVTITFLDVGQGDGICIRQKDGRGILIDCGSSGQSSLAKYRLVPFLKYQGIHTLDAIFLSHLDKDHTSGVLELLEEGGGIQIERLILGAGVPKDESWEELMWAAAQAGVAVLYMEEGGVYEKNGLKMTCLYDGQGADGANRNAGSMVLLFESGGFSALFTGDVEQDGERLLVESGLLPESCTLLKVAHHGSKSSTSETFLNRLNPELAVISCGQNNRYGHPHKEVLTRLEEAGILYYLTSKDGAVTVHLNQRRVECFKVEKNAGR